MELRVRPSVRLVFQWIQDNRYDWSASASKTTSEIGPPVNLRPPRRRDLPMRGSKTTRPDIDLHLHTNSIRQPCVPLPRPVPIPPGRAFGGGRRRRLLGSLAERTGAHEPGPGTWGTTARRPSECARKWHNDWRARTVGADYMTNRARTAASPAGR